MSRCFPFLEARLAPSSLCFPGRIPCPRFSRYPATASSLRWFAPALANAATGCLDCGQSELSTRTRRNFSESHSVEHSRCTPRATASRGISHRTPGVGWDVLPDLVELQRRPRRCRRPPLLSGRKLESPLPTAAAAANGRPRPQEMEGAGPPTEPPAPHPAVAPLAFLLGKWCGEGEGAFPTIAPFRYGEELLFSHHPSKPVISYTQRTWKAASGEPMHSESGYWRPRPDGSVEVVIAQSTGLAEVQKGSYDAENKTVTLQSELVGNASKVKQITRAFQVVDGELSYIVQMATISTSLQPHLKALLKKI